MSSSKYLVHLTAWIVPLDGNKMIRVFLGLCPGNVAARSEIVFSIAMASPESDSHDESLSRKQIETGARRVILF